MGINIGVIEVSKLENYERLLITVIDDEEKFDDIKSIRVLIQVIDDLREGYKYTRFRPSYIMSFSNLETEITLVTDHMDRKRAKDRAEMYINEIHSAGLSGKNSGGVFVVEKISTVYKMHPEILKLVGNYNKLHVMESELDRYKLTEYISKLLNLALYEQITLDREIGGYSDDK